MSTYPCSLYDGTGNPWPVHAFNGTWFPRGSAARDRESQKAWNFYEAVERFNANVRLQLSGTGWSPPSYGIRNPGPWFQFQTQGQRMLYLRGKLLHIELCPGKNWGAQSDRGISDAPITDVYPGDCEEAIREIRGFGETDPHSSSNSIMEVESINGGDSD